MRPSSVSFVALVWLAITSCAPSSPSVAPSGPQNDGSSRSVERKAVAVGILREPVSFITSVTGGNVSGGGANQVQYIGHDFLTVQDERGAWQPRIAAETLSVERGTWRANPDGTMDTTWRLRPNVKWQDGTPFTSADLLFAFEVSKDPEIPTSEGQAVGLMISASAPDASTVEIHWSGPYIRAIEANGLVALPRHLVEEQYREDKAKFISSTRFTTDFI